MESLSILQQNCKEVIDILPVNIMLINRALTVTYVNKTFKSNFGQDYIRALAKAPGDLLSCVNSKLNEKGCGYSEKCNTCTLRLFIKEVIASTTTLAPSEISISISGDYGVEKKWFKVQVLPLYSKQVEHFIITLEDISVYKQSNSQLLEHKKLADAANRAKSEFLANMSHEIRTPLNGVIGMVELTLLTELSEEQKENLEVAKNCADTLLELINNVLDLSKVESNKVILEEKQFSLKDLLQKVSDTQAAKILDKDLTFECIVEDKIPPYLYGDSFRLQQVLTNLLGNAVKFTEKGRVFIEVKQLCHFGDSSTIVFSVEDTGIGLAQNEINSLFKPFSQVDGSITRKYGGTGLGLAISQSLVHLMGGEIKVKSQKEKGSVFFFTIQMKSSTHLIDEVTNNIFDNTLTSKDSILIVEDDKSNQMVIKKMLNKMGYSQIDIASTGFEAIKLFGQKTYQVILMDIQLPELDGIGTTHIIREKEKKTNTHVPIIAITAHALKGDKEKFLQRGMDGYVAKPINPQILGNTLKEILNTNVSQKMEDNLKEAYASWQKPTIDIEKKISDSEKVITASDKRLFKMCLSEMNTLASEKITLDSFIQLEKKAHELKVKSQRKNYDSIKTQSFRLELASRKKDLEAVLKLLQELSDIVNKK